MDTDTTNNELRNSLSELSPILLEYAMTLMPDFHKSARIRNAKSVEQECDLTKMILISFPTTMAARLYHHLKTVDAQFMEFLKQRGYLPILLYDQVLLLKEYYANMTDEEIQFMLL